MVLAVVGVPVSQVQVEPVFLVVATNPAFVGVVPGEPAADRDTFAQNSQQ